MQASKSFVLRICLGLAVIAVLLAINLSKTPAKSIQQAEFEMWLMGQEELLEQAGHQPDFVSPVTLRLFSLAPDKNVDYRLSASSTLGARRALRLLQLIREADLFSASKWETDPGIWPGFSLLIEDGQRVFKTQLRDREIEDNIPAKTMLKLFQVYALAPLSTSATDTKTKESTETELEPTPQGME
jgi:hypothetical protein